jgi:hypothetical protein
MLRVQYSCGLRTSLECVRVFHYSDLLNASCAIVCLELLRLVRFEIARQ